MGKATHTNHYAHTQSDCDPAEHSPQPGGTQPGSGPGYCTALSGLLRPGLMGSTAPVLGAQLGEVPGEKISSHT